MITGDKNQYYLAQYEDQMIDANSIFKSVTRYGCVLPIIENDKDQWYCQRVINEALLELNHHGTGPVHIDVPIEAGMLAIEDTFTAEKSPEFKRISRWELDAAQLDLKQVFDVLQGKKVFIMCGQDDHIPSYKNELIAQIYSKYDCVFGVDKLSNLHGKGTIEVTRAAKRMSQNGNSLWPDVIISISGNPCMDYKFQLKGGTNTTEHWIVNPEGRIADPFKKLTTVLGGVQCSFLNRWRSTEVRTANMITIKHDKIQKGLVYQPYELFNEQQHAKENRRYPPVFTDGFEYIDFLHIYSNYAADTWTVTIWNI